MTKLFALFSLFIFAACSSRPDRIPLDATVAISPEFSAEASESVITALTAWQAASGDRFAPTLRIGDYEGAALYIKPGDSGEDALAYTDISTHDTAVMVVDAEAISGNRQDMVAVVQHELGHAFGLDHVSGTIMCDGCKYPRAIDSDTLSRFDENYR